MDGTLGGLQDLGVEMAIGEMCDLDYVEELLCLFEA